MLCCLWKVVVVVTQEEYNALRCCRIHAHSASISGTHSCSDWLSVFLGEVCTTASFLQTQHWLFGSINAWFCSLFFLNKTKLSHLMTWKCISMHGSKAWLPPSSSGEEILACTRHHRLLQEVLSNNGEECFILSGRVIVLVRRIYVYSSKLKYYVVVQLFGHMLFLFFQFFIYEIRQEMQMHRFTWEVLI